MNGGTVKQAADEQSAEQEDKEEEKEEGGKDGDKAPLKLEKVEELRNNKSTEYNDIRNELIKQE